LISPPRDNVWREREYVRRDGQIKIGRLGFDGDWSDGTGIPEWEEGWSLAILRLHAEIERLEVGKNLDRMAKEAALLKPVDDFEKANIDKRKAAIAILMTAGHGYDAVLRAIQAVPNGIVWWTEFNCDPWQALVDPDYANASPERQQSATSADGPKFQFPSDKTSPRSLPESAPILTGPTMPAPAGDRDRSSKPRSWIASATTEPPYEFKTAVNGPLRPVGFVRGNLQALGWALKMAIDQPANDIPKDKQKLWRTVEAFAISGTVWVREYEGRTRECFFRALKQYHDTMARLEEYREWSKGHKRDTTRTRRDKKGTAAKTIEAKTGK